MFLLFEEISNSWAVSINTIMFSAQDKNKVLFAFIETLHFVDFLVKLADLDI